MKRASKGSLRLPQGRVRGLLSDRYADHHGWLKVSSKAASGGRNDESYDFDDPKDIGQRARQIHPYDAGNFRMREANGEDVKLTENGKEYLVEPTADQMDDLMDAEQLVQEGTLYRLPSKT